MFLLILTVFFIVTLTLYLRRIYAKFSSHGVKTLRTVPILGNMYGIITRQKHLIDDLEDLYFKFPEERFVGRYEFLNPIVVVKDLELIKKIVIKDFEYFIDHRQVFDKNLEPLVGRTLFFLRGQEWKNMRSTLSPAFTSSKIRQMVPFMEEVGKHMLKVLEKRIEAAEGILDIDVKDLTTRFANDVIASCAFGLKVDSQTEEKNIFYEMGKNIATLNFKQLFLFIFNSSFPGLVKRLKIRVVSEATAKFFTDIFLDTMGEREAKKIIRPDMIHLLMQLKKGQLSREEQIDCDITYEGDFFGDAKSAVDKKIQHIMWSNDDLIAQAVIFLIAGFETTSSAMSFALCEIATHPEVQERLVEEIKETDAKNNGKIDYNSIQNMTYLDMVVSEILRLWPAVASLDRLCVKDYNLGKPQDNADSEYIIRKGEILTIPAWAIHRDPQYFPNPEKFDPERFSETNKHKINPLTYMPFGLGPRNCIGSRFALCEVKVVLYQILRRMEISPSNKLRTPIALAKDKFMINIDGGHWVKFNVRT